MRRRTAGRLATGSLAFTVITLGVLGWTGRTADGTPPVAGDTARVTALMVDTQCTAQTQFRDGEAREAACAAVIRAAYRVMDPNGSERWELEWDGKRDRWHWTGGKSSGG